MMAAIDADRITGDVAAAVRHQEDQEVAQFVHLAETAERGLRSAEQQQWRDRLEAELGNLRAVLAWTTDTDADAQDREVGLRLAGALWFFWFQRGLTEGLRIQVDATVAQAHSNFIAVRIMHDGEMSLFATGRYLDRIDVTSKPYRFIERLVVLDSQKIDTLLVIPL